MNDLFVVLAKSLSWQGGGCNMLSFTCLWLLSFNIKINIKGYFSYKNYIKYSTYLKIKYYFQSL